MTNILTYPLQSIDNQLFEDWKVQYPNAEIILHLPNEITLLGFDDAAGWAIIDLLDWTQSNDDGIMEVAIENLAKGSIRKILDFADWLAQKLYDLDTRAHAQHIGENAWQPNQYFSVDNFLYARCCVVANGATIYNQILQTPELMPQDITFEALLYLPSIAFERKTKHRYSYSPKHNFETFSNKQGWEASK